MRFNLLAACLYASANDLMRMGVTTAARRTIMLMNGAICSSCCLLSHLSLLFSRFFCQLIFHEASYFFQVQKSSSNKLRQQHTIENFDDDQ